MLTDKILPEIKEFISHQRVISSHCHHLPDEDFSNTGLSHVIKSGYCEWIEPTPEMEKTAIDTYVQKMKANTYFRWLNESLSELYGLEISGESFLELDKRIKQAHEDPAYHLKLLRDKCNYEYNVLDAYWAPGSNNGHPEIFLHTYRCDTYMNAYDYNLKTVYELSAYDFALSREDTTDFDSFVQSTEKNISSRATQLILVAVSRHKILRGLPRRFLLRTCQNV